MHRQHREIGGRGERRSSDRRRNGRGATAGSAEARRVLVACGGDHPGTSRAIVRPRRPFGGRSVEIEAVVGSIDVQLERGARGGDQPVVREAHERRLRRAHQVHGQRDGDVDLLRRVLDAVAVAVGVDAHHLELAGGLILVANPGDDVAAGRERVDPPGLVEGVLDREGDGARTAQVGDVLFALHRADHRLKADPLGIQAHQRHVVGQRVARHVKPVLREEIAAVGGRLGDGSAARRMRERGAVSSVAAPQQASARSLRDRSQARGACPASRR